MFEVKGKFGIAKIFSKNQDVGAIEQVQTLMDQPLCGCYRPHYARLPLGRGCTIGFTAGLGDNVFTNLVGVDIGCGIYIENIDKQDFDLFVFDQVVHQIPAGFGSWRKPIEEAPFMRDLHCFNEVKNSIIDVQVGTLGGGNHFIELIKMKNRGNLPADPFGKSQY